MVTVNRLLWDSFNVPHVARHNVTPNEVEQVCRGPHWTSRTYGRRLRVVGPTAAGRLLTVILAPYSRGVFYPVTARPASPRERDAYQEHQGDRPQ